MAAKGLYVSVPIRSDWLYDTRDGHRWIAKLVQATTVVPCRPPIPSYKVEDVQKTST
jgi:hypothetical protein